MSLFNEIENLQMAYYNQASFTHKPLKGWMMFITILSYTDVTHSFGLCYADWEGI